MFRLLSSPGLFVSNFALLQGEHEASEFSYCWCGHLREILTMNDALTDGCLESKAWSAIHRNAVRVPTAEFAKVAVVQRRRETLKHDPSAGDC